MPVRQSHAFCTLRVMLQPTGVAAMVDGGGAAYSFFTLKKLSVTLSTCSRLFSSRIISRNSLKSKCCIYAFTCTVHAVHARAHVHRRGRRRATDIRFVRIYLDEEPLYRVFILLHVYILEELYDLRSYVSTHRSAPSDRPAAPAVLRMLQRLSCAINRQTAPARSTSEHRGVLTAWPARPATRNTIIG